MPFSVRQTRNGLRVEWAGENGIDRFARLVGNPESASLLVFVLDLMTKTQRDSDELIERLRSIAPKARLKMTIAQWEKWKAGQPERRKRQTATLRRMVLESRKATAATLRKRVIDLHRREGLNATKIAERLRGDDVIVSRQRVAKLLAS
jgi:hypothetical protein